MKVQCPNCNAAYHIEDKMIPDVGIYAICRCNIRFYVQKDSGKAAEEPKLPVASKTEDAPRVDDAPKKALETLKSAEGKQKAAEDPEEIKRTLKYMMLAVIVSYSLLFGVYRIYFSPNKISPIKKYIEIIEFLKHRF